ncbi:MAG: sensor histidine kinase, partial [Terriglobales bacterium]
VSHDLRSPLGNISGLMEMLLAGRFGKQVDDAVRLIAMGQQSVKRMLTLINDLLDIEKMEAGMLSLNKTTFPISTAFKQSADAVVHTANYREIKLDVEPSTIEVNADLDRIVQILVNLLSNAIKFSDKGTTIELRAVELQDCIEISVIDQGRGVAAELRQKIFDRFQQVRSSDARESHGSGLGLAICKALVELHAGSIDVRSVDGEGSTFFFSLPRTSA